MVQSRVGRRFTLWYRRRFVVVSFAWYGTGLVVSLAWYRAGFVVVSLLVQKKVRRRFTRVVQSRVCRRFSLGTEEGSPSFHSRGTE